MQWPYTAATLTDYAENFTMRMLLLTAAATVLLAFPAGTFGIVIELNVTPEWVAREGARISVESKQLDGGAWKISIRHTVSQPTYLNSVFEIRQGGETLTTSRHTCYAEQPGETYTIIIANNHVAESVLRLSERSFADQDGGKTPLPGGTDYLIRMRDFCRALGEQELSPKDSPR